jgi:hypothetical protein
LETLSSLSFSSDSDRRDNDLAPLHHSLSVLLVDHVRLLGQIRSSFSQVTTIMLPLMHRVSVHMYGQLVLRKRCLNWITLCLSFYHLTSASLPELWCSFSIPWLAITTIERYF